MYLQGVITLQTALSSASKHGLASKDRDKRAVWFYSYTEKREICLFFLLQISPWFMSLPKGTRLPTLTALSQPYHRLFRVVQGCSGLSDFSSCSFWKEYKESCVISSQSYQPYLWAKFCGIWTGLTHCLTSNNVSRQSSRFKFSSYQHGLPFPLLSVSPVKEWNPHRLRP